MLMGTFLIVLGFWNRLKQFFFLLLLPFLLLLFEVLFGCKRKRFDNEKLVGALYFLAGVF